MGAMTTAVRGSEILGALEKDHALKASGEALEVADAATAATSAAKQLEQIQRLKKDEFETTAEFQERRTREVTKLTSQLPARFILPSAAESDYDADTTKLTVPLPSQLFSGDDGSAVVSVVPYGSRWPSDFVAVREPPSVVLSIARDEARMLKPALTWLIVARLPFAESNAAVAADRFVVISPRRIQVAMIPVAAFLFSKADGKVWHHLDFDLPANLRVLGTDATLNDWMTASEATRAKIVAKLFPSSSRTPIQLWIDARGAVERNQVAANEPLAVLARISDLPKPTVPVPVRQTRPKYPFEMRRAGITGEVVVGFKIKEDGTVANLKVERSSQREFEASAMACVAEWRFKPATLAGKPIAVVMAVPIVFTLNEE